jgi:hypothetical protein
MELEGTNIYGRANPGQCPANHPNGHDCCFGSYKNWNEEPFAICGAYCAKICDINPPWGVVGEDFECAHTMENWVGSSAEYGDKQKADAAFPRSPYDSADPIDYDANGIVRMLDIKRVQSAYPPSQYSCFSFITSKLREIRRSQDMPDACTSNADPVKNPLCWGRGDVNSNNVFAQGLTQVLELANLPIHYHTAVMGIYYPGQVHLIMHRF